MKTTICQLTALALPAVAMLLGTGGMPQTSSASELAMDSVLGIDQPDARHVIDLLMQNRHRSAFAHGAAVGTMPAGPVHRVVAQPQLGDLELLEVRLVAEGAGTRGPVYQVSFRNTSQFALRHFRISIVGVLCRIDPTSPCRRLTIPCIEAGETKCIEIELPARAMSMHSHGVGPAPFDTLIVALDSLDEFMECNELNNVSIMKRAEIGLLVAEAAAPAAPAPTPTAPAETVPTPAPGDKQELSPLDKIDLDELDLGDSEQEEAALRIALQVM